MEQATILKIFLASPGDVKPERDLIFALKDDLDHLIGKPNKIRFEFVNWERSAYPGIGEDAQDVINKNINDDYNIFIGIFWLRFGTPTNRSESGTQEEYNRAYEKYKSDPHSNHIMLYFKTASPVSIYEFDYTQFEKVKKFKKNTQSQGVLYWEFEKSDDLKSILLIHLASLVKDKYSNGLSREINSSVNENNELNKYELISRQIDEGKGEIGLDGIIELSELASDSMNALPNITKNIINSITFISNKFIEKTKQIDSIAKIKDDKLRIIMATKLINILAIDLDNYANELNDLMPEFSDTLNTAIESYTKLLLLASESSVFAEEVENQLQKVFPELYRSIDAALIGTAEFLRSLLDVPSMTSKFGSAKRKGELATNSLLKEFINSKKVMMQLMNEQKVGNSAWLPTAS
jgi:hypothetical protein